MIVYQNYIVVVFKLIVSYMMMIFKQFSVTHTLFHFDVLLYNSMNLLSVWLQLSFGEIDVKIFFNIW